MKEGVLIYPHQLFLEHPALANDRVIFVVEEPLFFTQYRFHKQKLVLHRASMKSYADQLIQKGYDVVYVSFYELKQTGSIVFLLKQQSVGMVHLCDVVDDWLEQRISASLSEHTISIVWHETPLFLSDRKTLAQYWKEKKNLLHHSFYVWQRKRLGILLENEKPVGGKWSFDADNRKTLPKNISLPFDMSIENNDYIQEAKKYIQQHFPSTYGAVETFSFAVTHKDAQKRLHDFFTEKLSLFGTYEDAIHTEHTSLFHSVLSPYLNIGLLTPQEVLDAVLQYAEKYPIALSSLEGFVRQLIGWREFIRMVYVYKGRTMRTKNALKATRKLPESWWRGDTGVLPLDNLIETVKLHAYSHHITRLMVAGNMMTLIGAHPDDCYQWFMEWYIDAYDWVMVPNVYGMALYADGGMMTTKPYISSSAYLMKMGNYEKGEWQQVWDALYWNFIDTHRQVFLENNRSSLMVHLYEKFSDEKKKNYKKIAQSFLESHYGKKL